MRNFGVIRSTQTGDILRLAPNYDNNRAYRANPAGRHTGGTLRIFLERADRQDRENLQCLLRVCRDSEYLSEICTVAAL